MVLCIMSACQEREPKPPVGKNINKDSTYAALSDEEKRNAAHALEGLDVADDLQVELFASEPMIGNPTNIDVDARGRVWMCETINYRPSFNPKNPERISGDRILILEDNNHDGKADTAKVFYQGNDINAALGIVVLGNKVIVSCSPNVFLFTDENGDDIADKKEVLFTHVGGEQSDHAIHSFTFGPDGRYYFNFGNAGKQLMDKAGKVIVDKSGNAVTDEGKPYRQGMVFRVDPDGSNLEVLGYNFRNNYEAAIDAFGTIWQSDNDDDGNEGTRINYVMEYGNYGYTDEMTGAGWQSRRMNMEKEIPRRHWHQDDPGSIPNLLLTGAGSPAGICVYEGNLLPKRFQNQVIHCEAGKNIVRAYPVEKSGAGYSAEIKPLLSGRDQWFRPVDVCTAPDGSLFVADWYDPGVGGNQMADFNRGRIYRIAPKASSYQPGTFDSSSAEGAAKCLASPNLALRYLGWQKLSSLGVTGEPALKPLWTDANPRLRARALWLLARIPGSGTSYISQALTDKDPDIRITGLRAARELLPDIIPTLSQMMNDPDPQVRREVALALHKNQSSKSAAIWTTLANQYDGNDRWYLEALGIGADGQWTPFLRSYLAQPNVDINASKSANIIWRSRTELALPLLITLITHENVPDSVRDKYFRAFDFIKSSKKNASLSSLLSYHGPAENKIHLNTLYQLNPAQPISQSRVRKVLNAILDSLDGTEIFVDLVGKYKLSSYNKQLLKMTLDYPDSSLGRSAASALINSGGSGLLAAAVRNKDPKKAKAAVKALAAAGSPASISILKRIIRDKTFPRDTRNLAVRSLAAGWNQSVELLHMLERKEMPKDLMQFTADALSLAPRKDVKRDAMKFIPVSDTTTGKSLPPINDLVKRNGNSVNGLNVFKTNCSSCHRIGDEGEDVGPALTKIGTKLPKEAIYTAIIRPDDGIGLGYEGYVFQLKDNNAVAGIITSETPERVEVVMQGGIRKTISKSEIASRTEMKNSLMPSNIYQSISQQELIDLVTFLSQKK